MQFSESSTGFSAAAAFLVYSLHHHGRKGGGGRALTNPFHFYFQNPGHSHSPRSWILGAAPPRRSRCAEGARHHQRRRRVAERDVRAQGGWGWCSSLQCSPQIGDVLLQINGQDCSMMTHKAAQDAIVGSGDRVELLVQRWSAPAPTPQGGKCSLGSSHFLRCLEAWCAAGWGSSNRTCPTGSDLHPDKLDRKPSGRGLALGREAQHHRQGFYTGRCRAWISICCSSCE